MSHFRTYPARYRHELRSDVDNSLRGDVCSNDAVFAGTVPEGCHVTTIDHQIEVTKMAAKEDRRVSLKADHAAWDSKTDAEMFNAIKKLLAAYLDLDT